MKKSDKEKSDGNKDMRSGSRFEFLYERPAGRIDSLAYSSLMYTPCVLCCAQSKKDVGKTKRMARRNRRRRRR